MITWKQYRENRADETTVDDTNLHLEREVLGLLKFLNNPMIMTYLSGEEMLAIKKTLEPLANRVKTQQRLYPPHMYPPQPRDMTQYTPSATATKAEPQSDDYW
jgi:hypothetical protein